MDSWETIVPSGSRHHRWGRHYKIYVKIGTIDGVSTANRSGWHTIQYMPYGGVHTGRFFFFKVHCATRSYASASRNTANTTATTPLCNGKAVPTKLMVQ